MRRAVLVAFLATVFFSSTNLVMAYQTRTHARMSLEAAKASGIGDRLSDIAPDEKLFSLDSLLSDGGLYLFGFTLFEAARPISGWITEGSIREDDWCCDPPLRFQYHFYNPIASDGSRGYLGLLTDSRQWGLEATPFATQSYSYRDARDYYLQALTATTERERKRNLSLTFRSLGQVAHLLEDAAQPQHTRNDSHATGSLYETYTDQVRRTLPYGGYAPVVVNTPSDLWSTPDGKGIADYSNRGFVSAGTNFSGTITGDTIAIQPNSNFPSPSGIGAVLERKQITDPDLLRLVGPDQPLTGEIWFVETPVTDNYAGSTVLYARTSTFSIFDEDLRSMGFDWTFTLNRFNFDAAHPLLVPRAVGYAAGLMQYFFRAGLEISAPDEVIYGMIDPTQSNSFSKLKLKVRNTSPTENMTGGTLLAIAKFHRNACYQVDLSGEAGGPNAPDIIACRTKDEEQAVSTPKTVTLNAGGAPQALSFDFTQSPIPVDATDLFLQVVYDGPLGNEPNAVVAGTKDLFEPTHITYFNGLDVTEINDQFYLFDQVVAGLEAGDPRFASVDLNQDKAYTVPPDLDVRPYDLNNVPVSFTGNFLNPVATISSLPAGRFARMTVLTDRPSLDFYPGPQHFQPPAAFNQVSNDGTTYFITSVSQFRGNWVTDADIIFFCVFSTSCNGNLANITASAAADATTPEPVTVTIQYP